ncbi:hypothetical protein AHF37_06758 [Paragonimus kellicotti]|nr:hypothetical protein AHF37_06758 [Paragonimus kellicotti]
MVENKIETVETEEGRNNCEQADGIERARFNVDRLLEDLVGPCGLWQWSLVIIMALSTISVSTFPVFANSASQHRCRMEDRVEKFALDRNFTFAYIASHIGPWTNISGQMKGCLRYELDWNVLNLTDFFFDSDSNYSHTSVPLESCPLGYIHEESAMHYPGNVIIEFETVCQKSWLVPTGTSVYMTGMLFGFILGGWTGDRFGRRPSIIFFSILELICDLWTCLSPNYINYVLARGITGIGNTAKIALNNVLMVELTTARHRSTLNAVLAIGLNFVSRAMMSLCAFTIPYWRWFYAVYVSPNLLTVAYIFYLPESPRWLLARSRVSEAVRVLQTGYRINHRKMSQDDQKRLDDLMQEALKMDSLLNNSPQVHTNKSTKKLSGSMLRPFTDRQFAKTSILCLLSLLGIVMSYFALLLYARIIRTYVYLVGFLNATTAIPATLIATLLYRYCRRRKLPLQIVITLVLCILGGGGLYTVIVQPESDLVLTVASNIGLILLSSALCMFYIYVPELYPSEIRTHAFGLILGFARIGSIVSTFVNELDRIVVHGFPVTVYAGTFVFVLIALFFLSDTTGENLPDVSTKG